MMKALLFSLKLNRLPKLGMCFAVATLTLAFLSTAAIAVTQDQLRIREYELSQKKNSLEAEIGKLNEKVDKLGRYKLYLEQCLRDDGVVVKLRESERIWEGYYWIPQAKIEDFIAMCTVYLSFIKRAPADKEVIRNAFKESTDAARTHIKTFLIPEARSDINKTFDKLTELHHELQGVKDEIVKVQGALKRGDYESGATEARAREGEAFAISLSYPRSVVVEAAKRDLRISWTGKPMFPITVTIRQKEGWKPPYGGDFRPAEKKFNEPDSEGGKQLVICKESVYCYGYRKTWAKTFTMEFQVKITDKMGDESEWADMNVECKVDK